MKKFIISEEEKNRILFMHKNRILQEQVTFEPTITTKKVKGLKDLIGLKIVFEPIEATTIVGDGDKWELNTPSSQTLGGIEEKIVNKLESHKVKAKIKDVVGISSDAIRIDLEPLDRDLVGGNFLKVDLMFFKCGEDTFSSLIKLKDLVSPTEWLHDKFLNITYSCDSAKDLLNQMLPCTGFDLSKADTDMSDMEIGDTLV